MMRLSKHPALLNGLQAEHGVGEPGCVEAVDNFYGLGLLRDGRADHADDIVTENVA